MESVNPGQCFLSFCVLWELQFRVIGFIQGFGFGVLGMHAKMMVLESCRSATRPQ